MSADPFVLQLCRVCPSLPGLPPRKRPKKSGKNLPAKSPKRPVPETNGTKWRFYCGIQQGRVPAYPRDGSRFIPGTGLACPKQGSRLSWTPSCPKCSCLLVFSLPDLSGHHSLFSVHVLFLQVFLAFIRAFFS